MVKTIGQILRGSIKLDSSRRYWSKLARRNNEVTKSRIYDLHGATTSSRRFLPRKAETFSRELTTLRRKSFGIYEEFLWDRMWITSIKKAHNEGYSRHGRTAENRFRKLAHLFPEKTEFIPVFYYNVPAIVSRKFARYVGDVDARISKFYRCLNSVTRLIKFENCNTDLTWLIKHYFVASGITKMFKYACR